MSLIEEFTCITYTCTLYRSKNHSVFTVINCFTARHLKAAVPKNYFFPSITLGSNPKEFFFIPLFYLSVMHVHAVVIS